MSCLAISKKNPLKWKHNLLPRFHINAKTRQGTHMNFFKKLLDSLRSPVTQDLRAEPQINEAEAANLAARLAGEACLDRHWRSVGTVERDVIAFLYDQSEFQRWP